MNQRMDQSHSSNSDVLEDYVSTGTDVAEAKLYASLNEGIVTEDDYSDDLSDAGWIPTGAE